ncbi:MAG TPA: hypothetical protein VIM70_20305 [Clostridium sp.]|uniref:hypothetical protein n=1 Tax=Clostridium sp. TaxID=1506 RepID=UPI002F956F4B
MKMKSWLKYLIFIILIFFMIILREYVEKLYLDSHLRFESAMYFYLVINLLLGVCIGLILGLEHLLSEFRKEGMWKINFPKLILVGIPSLYFSLTNVWFLGKSQFLREIISYPLHYFFRYGSSYISLFQVILGYVVITSFFKYNEKI